MKYCWRITKYDPKKRNLQGWFLEDTWISYGDIGSVYQGKKLTYNEYVHVEDLYINAIVQFMKCLNISTHLSIEVSLFLAEAVSNRARRPARTTG